MKIDSFVTEQFSKFELEEISYKEIAEFAMEITNGKLYLPTNINLNLSIKTAGQPSKTQSLIIANQIDEPYKLFLLKNILVYQGTVDLTNFSLVLNKKELESNKISTSNWKTLKSPHTQAFMLINPREDFVKVE